MDKEKIGSLEKQLERNPDDVLALVNAGFTIDTDVTRSVGIFTLDHYNAIYKIMDSRPAFSNVYYDAGEPYLGYYKNDFGQGIATFTKASLIDELLDNPPADYHEMAKGILSQVRKANFGANLAYRLQAFGASPELVSLFDKDSKMWYTVTASDTRIFNSLKEAKAFAVNKEDKGVTDVTIDVSPERAFPA